ncbi:hypothetical protein ACHAXT_003719 [Thalassiosira profunda]
MDCPWGYDLIADLQHFSGLESLSLRYTIPYGWTVLLTTALAGCKTLKTLELELWNRTTQYDEEGLLIAERMTASGWQTFFDQLEHATFVLETLDLSGNDLGDSLVTCLVARLHLPYLAELTTLKFATRWESRCILEGLVRDAAGAYRVSTTSTGWGAFASCLCNTSSIAETFASNHTLQLVDTSHDAGDIPSDLAFLSQLNGSEDKFGVARRKIIHYHFHDGNNLHDLADFEVDLYPRVIAWLGRDLGGLPLLYQFIRGMPSLCGPTVETTAGVEACRGADDTTARL